MAHYIGRAFSTFIPYKKNCFGPVKLLLVDIIYSNICLGQTQLPQGGGSHFQAITIRKQVTE